MLRVLLVLLVLSAPVYAQTQQIPPEPDYSGEKVAVIVIGALLGGITTYGILNELFAETVIIGDTIHFTNVPVVSDIEAQTGMKLLVAMVGATVSGAVFSQFYDEYHERIERDSSIIINMISGSVDDSFSWTQDRIYDTRDFIEVKYHEYYDRIVHWGDDVK